MSDIMYLRILGGGFKYVVFSSLFGGRYSHFDYI